MKPDSVVARVWSLLARRERWHLSILFCALVLRAAVEMGGVASIVPFMSVVADPDLVLRSGPLNAVYHALGFTSTSAFLTALGVAVIAMLAITNAVGALATYGMLRFAWGLHHRLSLRMLEGYLAQPYGFFVERNTASLSKKLLSEIETVIAGVVIPLVDVAARLLVVVALVGLLIYLDPVLALVVALTLGGAYGLIYTLLIRRKQRRLGVLRTGANERRFRISAEAFGGIKDLKILQREQAFLSAYRPASWDFARATASSALVSQLPRYLLETIAFGGVVLIVLLLLKGGDGVERVLPIISLYAFVGYRLMPELQRLFSSLATVRFKQAALDELLDDHRVIAHTRFEGGSDPVRLTSGIALHGVSFRYPGVERPVLRDIRLEIPRNRTVALVGPSGSGKTTLVDLILGLYPPERGEIRIGGTVLGPGTVRDWHRQIGYVPQTIFLTDDTIAANIAFGVPPSEIDQERVARAARIAHLNEFVLALPEGFETVVGERGVRLSGGQRQRIGIARALYRDPEVLILDEATSALDGATESALMDTIRELSGEKTIVLVAHRLSTVRDADAIYVVEDGEVVASGTFDELMARDARFRRLAGVLSHDEPPATAQAGVS